MGLNATFVASIKATYVPSLLIGRMNIHYHCHFEEMIMDTNQEIQDIFGLRLKDIRRRKGLTQEQLSDLSGLSIQFIGEIERGKRNPSLTTLKSIAEAVEMNVADLLNVDEFQMSTDEMRKFVIDKIESADEAQLQKITNLLRIAFEE